MARTVLHKAPPASDNLVKIHYHEYANHNNVNASGEVLYWRTNAFTTTTDGADLIVSVGQGGLAGQESGSGGNGGGYTGIFFGSKTFAKT